MSRIAGESTNRAFLFQRYMPFWLAAFAERVAIILIPLLGIMVPLIRMAPALYGWRVRRRVIGVYTDLRTLEREVDAQGRGAVSPSCWRDSNASKCGRTR